MNDLGTNVEHMEKRYLWRIRKHGQRVHIENPEIERAFCQVENNGGRPLDGSGAEIPAGRRLCENCIDLAGRGKADNRDSNSLASAVTPKPRKLTASDGRQKSNVGIPITTPTASLGSQVEGSRAVPPGNQMVRQRGLRGGTYGPASKGKTFTVDELAAYAQEHGGAVSPRSVKRAVRQIVDDGKYKEPSLAVLMGEKIAETEPELFAAAPEPERADLTSSHHGKTWKRGKQTNGPEGHRPRRSNAKHPRPFDDDVPW